LIGAILSLCDVETRTTTSSLLGAICTGEEFVVHGNNSGEATVKHAGPFSFADLLAVVGTGQRLCQPFLLEEGL
jgi:hypothetical protein